MTSKYYEKAKGRYVLELEGNLRHIDEIEKLEKATAELAQKIGIKRVVIYQSDSGLKIDSKAFGKVLGLCSILGKNNTDFQFAEITGDALKYFGIAHITQLFPEKFHKTLDEALEFTR